MFKFYLRKENLARFPIHLLKNLGGEALAVNVFIAFLLGTINALFAREVRAGVTLDNWHSRQALAYDAREHL